MTLPNALVVRVGSSDKPTLRALDLRDPDQPAISPPTPMALPADGRILSAFAAGSTVYYTYLVPRSEDAPKTPPEASFFFGAVEFSTPTQPTVRAAVNVPGQLLAVSGDTLYTREFVRRENVFETLVHRLVVRGGRIVREATGSVGGRVAVALQLDGAGHLLVDLREQLDLYFSNTYQWPTTDLAVLDANTLELLGQTRVGPQARRLAFAEGRVIYDAAEALLIVDARVPTAPATQAYLPLLQGVTPRVLVANGSLLVQDVQSIKQVELNFANILR